MLRTFFTAEAQRRGVSQRIPVYLCVPWVSRMKIGRDRRQVEEGSNQNVRDWTGGKLGIYPGGRVTDTAFSTIEEPLDIVFVLPDYYRSPQEAVN